jgi:hypothetical protein
MSYVPQTEGFRGEETDAALISQHLVEMKSSFGEILAEPGPERRNEARSDNSHYVRYSQRMHGSRSDFVGAPQPNPLFALGLFAV